MEYLGVTIPERIRMLSTLRRSIAQCRREEVEDTMTMVRFEVAGMDDTINSYDYEVEFLPESFNVSRRVSLVNIQ